MLFQKAISTDVDFISCAECGTVFGMSKELRARFVKNGKEFYCPVGHKQWYGKSEADKLKEQLTAKNTELLRAAQQIEREETRTARLGESLHHTKRRLSATKGVVTRTKNRIANGVCPCCDRYFADVHRHMMGQHPDYTQDADVQEADITPEPLDTPPPTGDAHEAQAPAAPGELGDVGASVICKRGRPVGSRNAVK